jgi:hypothetical protein
MLPPFIIEQIRRREELERQKREADRPRLQLPLDSYYAPPRPEDPGVERESHVVIVDMM